jgi:cellulose biosynthesis protein BcsQ
MKDNEAAIIAVESQKGGAGKSMLVLNLAVAAVTKGKTVLVIDCDPHQNNSKTYDMRIKKREIEADILTVNSSFAKNREAQQQRNFDLVALKRLKIEDVIATYKNDYDLIVMDTAGGLETKTNVSAALHSDICLFPFNCGKYDLDTSEYVQKLVESIRNANTKNKKKTLTQFRSVLLFKPFVGKAKALKIVELTNDWKLTHPRLPAAIMRREIYEEAQAKGKGVCELGTVYSQQAAKEMYKVYEEIEKLIAKMRGAK